MIALDIETTGLSEINHGMISLGAIEIETGQTFYGECRIDDNDQISDKALSINGFTPEQVRDTSKIEAHELYLKFLKWAEKYKDPILIGQNLPSFDVRFLKYYHFDVLNNEHKWIFGHRYIDLHTYVFAKTGKSQSHDETLEMLGMEPEDRPHNALNGAMAVVDIFSSLGGAE